MNYTLFGWGGNPIGQIWEVGWGGKSFEKKVNLAQKKGKEFGSNFSGVNGLKDLYSQWLHSFSTIFLP